MKIESITLKNFRGYKEKTKIDFLDLTVLVGKNDCGKSTILDALDIFFNDGKGINKIDKSDINKTNETNGDTETIISVTFSDLPTELIIDSNTQTTLKDEFLLNDSDNLEIEKRYSSAGSPKVYIKANHPSHSSCSGLISKKITDLKKIVKEYNIECDNKTTCSILRKAIWQHFENELALKEQYIEVASKDAEMKSIWEKLQSFLPLYTLFQSDRKNSDGDSEIQDPLMQAVKVILADSVIQTQFNEIANKVRLHLEEVSKRTLKKVKEMNPEIADSLTPKIPDSSLLKWSDVFKKVSITGDADIPLNKRGSGVRRLILINFFRAEAERLKENKNSGSIIYAIEEPETAQHKEHQVQLINALKELSLIKGNQVIITTHSSDIVKRLDFSDIRLVQNDPLGNKSVEQIQEQSLPYPSLNEINFIAFDDVSEEYHNELYGHIEEIDGGMKDYEIFISTQPCMSYVKIMKNGNTKTLQINETEYVRHQIHHPENKNNKRFDSGQLKNSVSNMRDYILNKNKSVN